MRPETDLDTGFIPTGFSQKQIAKELKLGEEMANKVMEMGPGESFNKFLNLAESELVGSRKAFLKEKVVFV